VDSLERACPICESTDRRPFWRKPEVSLVRCGACGMTFASPVPRLYLDGGYYEDAGRPFYLSPAKLDADFSPVRFERELRIFRRYCRRGRVLDVGCSTGAFLWGLRRRFAGEYEVLGTDVSGPALAHAESLGLPTRSENLLAEGWPPRAFDAVTFWAVLEHVADPRAFLRQAEHVLKPGGFCFVLTPNFESLATRLLGPKYRYILGQHLNYFRRGDLRRLASPPFEPVDYFSTHFNPAVIRQDWRAGRVASDAERAELLQRTTALKQNPWLAPIRVAYRLVERTLGRLNLADNAVWVLRKPA